MLETIDIKDLLPNPYQPKGRLDIPDDIRQWFGESILAQGIIQKPVVRKGGGATHYECGDGWLRRSGCEWLTENGHPEYSSIEVDVRELSDQQMADIVMEANTVRKDLNPIEEAELYKKYIADFGVTQEKLGELHGHSQSEIANKLRLLALPELVTDEIRDGAISGTHGRTLIPLIEYPTELKEMVASLKVRPTSKADLEKSVRVAIWQRSESLNPNEYQGPKFDLGECTDDCKHRRMLSRPYQNDGPKEPRCFSIKCFNKKSGKNIAADRKKVLDAVKAKGVTDILKGEPAFGKHAPLSGGNTIAIGSKKECQTCPKRAAFKHYYGDSYIITCMDVTCHNKKAKAAEKDKNRKENEKTTAEAAERVAVFSAITIAKDDVSVVDHEALVLCFECIMRGGYHTTRAVAEALGLYDTSGMSRFNPLDTDLVVPVLRAKSSAELLNMLPYFTFEALRERYEHTPQQHQGMIPKFKECVTYSEPSTAEVDPIALNEALRQAHEQNWHNDEAVPECPLCKRATAEAATAKTTLEMTAEKPAPKKPKAKKEKATA